MYAKKTSKSTKNKGKKVEKEVEILEEVFKNIDEEFEKKTKKLQESIREALILQLNEQGKIDKYFENMVDDYVYLVGLKEHLQRDIDLNGIRYLYTGGNGFKSFKPNESCERLLKTNGQMLKILQDLNLKEPSEKPENGDDDDLC